MGLIYQNWELEITKKWHTDKIRNYIWLAVECHQPIPACVSVDALRAELIIRGLEPVGYHNS